MVVGRVEEAAGRVGEAREDPVHQRPGGREPALVERRLVEREQAVGEVRVVLEDARADRPAVLPRPPSEPSGASSPSTIAVAARSAADSGPQRRIVAREPIAASANAAIASPFQAASALSSRAGWGRVRRAAPAGAPRASARRASTAAVGQAEPVGELGVGRDPRQDRPPSQLPVVGHAVGGGNSVGARRPRTSRISAARQVNVRPSMPSVSASWLAAKAPSAVVSSRIM